MDFRYQDIVPWGRSFDEYLGMFDLSEDDLARDIVGVGDGPASFNFPGCTSVAHFIDSLRDDPMRLPCIQTELAAEFGCHASEFRKPTKLDVIAQALDYICLLKTDRRVFLNSSVWTGTHLVTAIQSRLMNWLKSGCKAMEAFCRDFEARDWAEHPKSSINPRAT